MHSGKPLSKARYEGCKKKAETAADQTPTSLDREQEYLCPMPCGLVPVLWKRPGIQREASVACVAGIAKQSTVGHPVPVCIDSLSPEHGHYGLGDFCPYGPVNWCYTQDHYPQFNERPPCKLSSLKISFPFLT